jgi:hypothetical protein
MADPPEQDPRVYFAAERTFLAWLRTGLALMGFGFVVAGFGLFLRDIALTAGSQVPTAGASRWFGIGLLIVGCSSRRPLSSNTSPRFDHLGGAKHSSGGRHGWEERSLFFSSQSGFS